MDINAYPRRGVMFRDAHSLVVAPHHLLRPYIANYTFTHPHAMPEQQAVLPSASCTLVYSAIGDRIIDGLRGVSTRPAVIGGYAKQFAFMFLIEFHAAGLYPFTGIDQHLLRDAAYAFDAVSKSLNRQIAEAYWASGDIQSLLRKLDVIFLSRLADFQENRALRCAMQTVRECAGAIPVTKLARSVFYSEKQLNRLFQRHIGTGVKTFARIVRMNHAASLLRQQMPPSQIIDTIGHYDAAHFSHDFKTVYGITPGEYAQNMSLFYNDPFKLGDYTESN